MALKEREVELYPRVAWDGMNSLVTQECSTCVINVFNKGKFSHQSRGSKSFPDAVNREFKV